MEVLELIIHEYTVKEMAEKLFVSEKTIETHKRNLFKKLQVKNVAGLVRKSLQTGILQTKKIIALKTCFLSVYHWKLIFNQSS